MWIERHLGPRILAAARQYPAVLLTGARQTGKTSLLRHLFPTASFVSLDLPSAGQQADERGGEFLASRPEPVLIDEVQYAPGLFRHLKAAIDVRLALRVGSLRDFERFLRACALRSGQLVNLADLARDVGIAGSTARDWLSVLQASGQIVLLEPWFQNPTKRLIKTPKLYFLDTGLLAYLLVVESAASLPTHPLIGAIWETFVLGQLLRARARAGSSAQVHFWRDVHGTEVDFVVEQNGRVRLIEAKWTETFRDRRPLEPLLRVRDAFGDRALAEHWIACRTQHPHTLPGLPGIRLVNGFDFDDWLGT